jgi:hypothetical protein
MVKEEPSETVIEPVTEIRELFGQLTAPFNAPATGVQVVVGSMLTDLFTVVPGMEAA